MPTLAVEVGWSESLPQLHNDMNLLLVGSGTTRVVIVIKCPKISSRVNEGRDWNSRQKVISSKVLEN